MILLSRRLRLWQGQRHPRRTARNSFLGSASIAINERLINVVLVSPQQHPVICCLSLSRPACTECNLYYDMKTNFPVKHGANWDRNKTVTDGQSYIASFCLRYCRRSRLFIMEMSLLKIASNQNVIWVVYCSDFLLSLPYLSEKYSPPVFWQSIRGWHFARKLLSLLTLTHRVLAHVIQGQCRHLRNIYDIHNPAHTMISVWNGSCQTEMTLW